MKAVCISLMICSFGLVNFSFAQIYEFDKIVISKMSSRYDAHISESTYIFNTKDYSYRMYVYSRKDSIKARITDFETHKEHYFFMDKEDSLKLKFLQTITFREKEPKKYIYEFSKIKKKGSKKKLVLKMFDDTDKKVATYNLRIEETDFDLFTAFRLSYLEEFDFTPIPPPFNFMVVKAVGINEYGNMFKYELKSIKDIDFSITVRE